MYFTILSAYPARSFMITQFFADVRHDKRKALQKSILLMSFQREIGAIPSTNESELTRKFVRLHKEEYSRSTIEGSLGRLAVWRDLWMCIIVRIYHPRLTIATCV